ncbi:MAG: hypothetical protein GYA56_11780 [Geobacteraceae bacterium]|nr:hypothetical protein [Geobacteraceae bacterium]
MTTWQVFTCNLPIKLLALALAVALWLMASEAKQVEMELSLPVVLRNRPPGLAVLGAIPPDVRVTVAGRKFSIRRVRTERAPVELDLKGLGEGTVSFASMDKRLRLPPGVSTLRVFPATIEVKLVRSAHAGSR